MKTFNTTGRCIPEKHYMVNINDKLAQISRMVDDVRMLYAILFKGNKFAYNPYSVAINLRTMFGYIEDNHGVVTIANRIFEMSLYNYFLSEEQLTSPVYLEAQKNKNQFGFAPYMR